MYAQVGFWRVWEAQKTNTACSYGGFFDVLRSKQMRNRHVLRWIFVGFGSTTLEVTLSLGTNGNQKLSKGIVDFGCFLEAQN